MTKKTKLWMDCSKEEHKAVRDWNKKRKQVFEDYRNGIISQRQFKLRLNKLSKELDEIEEKYK